MDSAESSIPQPYKQLWKKPLIGQTIDVKLDCIYEGLGEIQKLILEKSKEQPERLVKRRTQFNSVIDPTKPGYPSISNMVSTMRTIEDLENEYNQAESSEDERILEQINQLQLQCNMEGSGEMIPDSADSGIGQPEANPHPQLTPQQDI